MLNLNKVLDIAIKKDASDVHLINGLKPILRISRELKAIEEEDVIGDIELYEAYDFFVRGNIDAEGHHRYGGTADKTAACGLQYFDKVSTP